MVQQMDEWTPIGQRLPRKARLSGQKLIRSIIERRQRYTDGLLAVYIAANNLPYPRLGVCVSKACGTAVTRNRWKRLIKEAFRLNQAHIPAGFDYMVMVCQGNARALQRPTLERVRQSLLGLVNRAFDVRGNKQPS